MINFPSHPFVNVSRRLLTIILVLWLASSTCIALSTRVGAFPAMVSDLRSKEAIPSLPLFFIPNMGQAAPVVHYQVQAAGGTIYFADGEVVVVLPHVNSSESETAALGIRRQFGTNSPANRADVVLRQHFVGANPSPELAAGNKLGGTVNSFIGNDASKWLAGVPMYDEIVYKELYPGIDLHYEGLQGELEGTFVIAPGANPERIRWLWQGAETIKVDSATGDLDIVLPYVGETDAVAAERTMKERSPFAWQIIDGRRTPVQARYQVHSDGTIGFGLGSYDASSPLILDPVLSFSTYLGGSRLDRGLGIALDAANNIYVMGETRSVNFPTGPVGFGTPHDGISDIFVAKLDPSGTALLYVTFLGGSDYECVDIENGCGFAVDATGYAYIAGTTRSWDFPTTPGAFGTTYAGNDDAFVVRLSPDGDHLLYSTYLGGRYADNAIAVAIDQGGNAYVTGDTISSDFPTTPGAFDTGFDTIGYKDGFVAKLNSEGSALLYSTFLGGSSQQDYGKGIAIDDTGSAYVTGFTRSADFPVTVGAYDTTCGTEGLCDGGADDAFVLKLTPDGAGLAYATFAGGMASDYGWAIAVDDAGSAYVTGYCSGSSFFFPSNVQTCSNAAYVMKLSPTGDGAQYITLVGHWDVGRAIAVDQSGHVFITGETGSAEFPTTAEAVDSSYNGRNDAFVAKLTPDGTSIDYGTFLGGSDDDYGIAIAVNRQGSILVTGRTLSADFLTANPVQPVYGSGDDAFVAQITDNLAPTVVANGPYGVPEGGSVSVTASGSDPEGGTLAFSWDLDANGVFEASGQNVTFSAADLDGPSPHTITVQATDQGGLTATDQTIVGVTNATPTVGALVVPHDTIRIDSEISVSSSFQDPGVLDSHTAVWDWGDGSTSAGVVSESQGSGAVTGNHVYASAGVYTVRLIVVDDDGGTGLAIFEYVIVYDLGGGFVTGGGWINSPAGACKLNTACQNATGPAIFGFVAKYRPGSSVPIGSTQFQFRAGNVNFHICNYQWLVVAGSRAKFKGDGTINGQGDFGFMVTVIDGHLNSGGGVDKLRMKIWDNATGTVVYDNQLGSPDDGDPAIALGGGSIVIHRAQ